MTTRLRAGAAIAATVALVAVGCGGEGDGTGSDDTAGRGEPIRIGASLGLTGDFAPDSGLVEDGYTFWAESVNAAGGIRVGDERREVELIIRDDGSDTDETVNIVQGLITQEDVDFLLAPWGSGNTNAVAPVVERNQIPMIAPLASSDEIWEQGYEYLYGTIPPASETQKPQVDAAHEAGAETVAIVSTDSLFPLFAAQGAEQRAEELGLDVVLSQTYPPDQLDLGALITSIQDADADLVISTADTNDAILMVRQMKERNYSPRLLGFAGPPATPDFIENLGSDAELVSGIVWWTPELDVRDELFGSAAEFAQNFEERFGYTPTHDSASAAIAGYALQLAIESAGTLDHEDVLTALNDLDVETSFGMLNFDENHVNTGTTSYVTQIQDGDSAIVYPSEFASGEMVYPVPPWGER